MPQEPKIELAPESLDTDAIITFPEDNGLGRDNLWITVHLGEGRPSLSLNIVKTDEGIVLDLYPLDGEDGEAIATTYAFDSDAEEVSA